jgi:hypothetical protein
MQIQDLPRDINCHLSSIRAPLVRLVNSARHSEGKAELLRETLEVALANLPPKVEQRVETLTEPPETAAKKPARKRATAKVKKDG